MKLIAGLLTLDAGEISLDDRRITRLKPPERREVAMVFQNPFSSRISQSPKTWASG